MSTARQLLFDLDSRLLEALASECAPTKVVEEFARAMTEVKKGNMDKLSQQIFGGYGKAWVKRVLELSNHYPDRPYELLKEYCARPKVGPFPSLIQRLLEAAYLGIHPISMLRVTEATFQRLAYQLAEGECAICDALRARCSGEVAQTMPCRYVCLSACETACRELKAHNVRVSMTGTMGKDGLCQFVLSRGKEA